MSSKHTPYRSLVVRLVTVGMAIALVGVLLLFSEPTARADQAVHHSSHPSATLTQGPRLAQGPSRETLEATVYRDPNCGCCEAWMEHLRASGFQVSEVQQANMDAVKQRYHVPSDLSSCHTALVHGAVIEGHVPADDIKRFISEESDAIGLVVPGMPVGSPGMEVGEIREPFAVFSFNQQGTTEVFNQY